MTTRLSIFTSILSILILSSCCRKSETKKEVKTTSEVEPASLEETNKLKTLSKHLKDTVQLADLINGLLIPQRAQLVCKLKTSNNGNGWYEYENGNYNFKLQVIGNDPFDAKNNNTIFYDGRTKTEFKGKQILTTRNETFDYGINQMSSLANPVIIRIGKEEFLHSSLNFGCNGIGCGVEVFFIYHIRTKKSTFISNFRYYISDLLLTDFEQDGIPDLLIIEDESINELSPFNVNGFKIKLIAFEFVNGSFKPKINSKNNSVFRYELTGLGDLDHKYELPVSITKNNWFTMGSLE